VLNSELKYLYTALTRARVNVWIFDEDANARAPMFEYFRACHLVEVVTKEGTDVTEQGTAFLYFIYIYIPLKGLFQNSKVCNVCNFELVSLPDFGSV